MRSGREITVCLGENYSLLIQCQIVLPLRSPGIVKRLWLVTSGSFRPGIFFFFHQSRLWRVGLFVRLSDSTEESRCEWQKTVWDCGAAETQSVTWACVPALWQRRRMAWELQRWQRLFLVNGSSGPTWTARRGGERGSGDWKKEGGLGGGRTAFSARKRGRNNPCYTILWWSFCSIHVFSMPSINVKRGNTCLLLFMAIGQHMLHCLLEPIFGIPGITHWIVHCP